MPKVLNGIGRVFSIQEIADIFNVSVLTIRKYCREGKLNCQKIGKTMYVKESALNEFLDGKSKDREEKKQEEVKETKKEKKPEKKSKG
jgi:excisionase family DNA binding protein